MKVEEIRSFLEDMGIPGRDLYDIPDSSKSFPDGGHFRIEIAGIERPSTLEAMLDEARRRGTTVHRVIATVGGASYCDFGELKKMAALARAEGIEVIMTIGPRKAWDAGAKESVTPEGMSQGYRLRGSDAVVHWLTDMDRCLEAGMRGFLVYDEGILSIVVRMRERGLIPPNTVFKFSVFGGYAGAAGALLLEKMGVNSMNPVSDVSLPILAGIRRAVDMPLDVYISVVDAFGGMFRLYEAPEIARVASPCYFKIEPGESEAGIYKPWVDEAWHASFAREKVKMASIITEIMERHAPGLKISPPRSADLVVPE